MGKDGRGRGIRPQLWVAVVRQLVREQDRLVGPAHDLQRNVDDQRLRLVYSPAGPARLDVGEVCVRVLVDELLGPNTQLVGTFPGSLRPGPLAGSERGALLEKGGRQGQRRSRG